MVNTVSRVATDLENLVKSGNLKELVKEFA